MDELISKYIQFNSYHLLLVVCNTSLRENGRKKERKIIVMLTSDLRVQPKQSSQRDRERQRQRQRERETETERERQRETERDRERQIDRQTDR